MNESVSKMFDLTGKVAALIGSGRGIGLAMAQTLAAAGCSVALQDIDLPVAQKWWWNRRARVHTSRTPLGCAHLVSQMVSD